MRGGQENLQKAPGTKEKRMKEKSLNCNSGSKKSFSLWRYAALCCLYTFVSPDGARLLLWRLSWFSLRYHLAYACFPALIASVTSVIWLAITLPRLRHRQSLRWVTCVLGVLCTVSAFVGTFFWTKPLSPWSVLICVLLATLAVQRFLGARCNEECAISNERAEW